MAAVWRRGCAGDVGNECDAPRLADNDDDDDALAATGGRVGVNLRVADEDDDDEDDDDEVFARVCAACDEDSAVARNVTVSATW